MSYTFPITHVLICAGYSAPDAFFGECWSGIGVLMTESLMGVIMNSFTLTLLYQVCCGLATFVKLFFLFLFGFHMTYFILSAFLEDSEEVIRLFSVKKQ